MKNSLGFIDDEHESYGMLAISRVFGSHGENLFGSSIKHNNTIRLKISKGRISRGLNKDWFSATKPYIEVEMSYSQFAEAITSLNCGDGVPCTVKYAEGKEMEQCPHVDKRQQFADEFGNDMKELNEKLKKLTEDAERILSDKKPPSKAGKETILNQIAMLRQDISSNIPFVANSFNEQMDKTVLEAKGEIEGFVTHKIISAGLEGLQKEIKMLGDSED